MSEGELKSMWKMMNNFHFSIIDNDSIDKFTCIICKKLMIKACKGNCGCRYCSTCIMEYLSDKNNTHCPGNNTNCLNDVNPKVDLLHNILISKQIVKCTKSNCNFQTQLKDMENHMKLCGLNCTNKDNNDEVDSYAKVTNTSSVDNTDKIPSKTELDILREENEKLRIDITNMKLDIELKHDMITSESRKQSEINNLKVENLKTDLEASKLETENLKGEIKVLKENGIKYQNEMELYKKENNEKMHQIEKKFIDKNKDEKITQKKIENLSLKVDSIEQKILNIDTAFTIMKEIQEQQRFGEFMWKMENISEKKRQATIGIDTDLYSDSFYSHKNGYKMCLNLNPNGIDDGEGTHMSLFFCIMKGPFDDILAWPFVKNVTFSLINQQTKGIYLSETGELYNHRDEEELAKPTSERNDGFGFSQFIELNELYDNPVLVKNDQIFIKCTIEL